ncbi:MAG: hypothetical protein SH807_09315 [Blastochloris sp.]|nr:hypothetical protein [Blastochloris sp.]
MKYRWIWMGGIVMLLFALALVRAPYLKDALYSWLESEGFRVMLGTQVSKAMKMDGEFGPLQVQGWEASTPEYRATGWPGEAIGSLEAEGVRGTFNPWAIFRRVWEIKRIDVERGTFALRLPQDELKRQTVLGKKPWYAWLMPTRFYCGWIECPKAQVIFPFQGKQGRLRDVHLGATMVGRDFKYFIYDGILEFPLLPDLKIEQLRMLITREVMDIEYASLSGLNGDRAGAEIQARVGMREDKSIRAKVSVKNMPFGQVMPEVVKARLRGRVSGKLNWNTDPTGKEITSDGELRVSETVLQDWVWLDELARLHNNLELKKFDIDEGMLKYQIRDQRFMAKELDLHVRNKVRLKGSLEYAWGEGRGKADLSFDEVPVQAWLPEEFKVRVAGDMKGWLKWEGLLEDWKGSQASGMVNMDGTRVRYPFSSIAVLKKAGLRFPEEVDLRRAQVDFSYGERQFKATRFEFDAGAAGHLLGKAEWTVDDRLTAAADFQLSEVQRWLPKEWAEKVKGDLSGNLAWTSKGWKWQDARGKGTFQLAKAQLSGMEFQQQLQRFLKKEGFERLDFKRAELDWEAVEGGLKISRLDFFVPSRGGVRGQAFIGQDKKVRGKIQVGLRQEDLTWLPEATTRVFKNYDQGLYWATVTLSGTTEKPQHDLTKQIMAVLSRHPFALMGLAWRGLSWWLGDALGTYGASKE